MRLDWYVAVVLLLPPIAKLSIQLLTRGQTQYGHVVSELAEILVPLAAAGMVWWDAKVPRQRKHNVR